MTRRTALPEPWRRVDGIAGKLFARYAHPAGYEIAHCGHPTALWPYALWAPGPAGGQILITAPNGRAWRTVALAAAEVERRLASHVDDTPARLEPVAADPDLSAASSSRPRRILRQVTRNGRIL